MQQLAFFELSRPVQERFVEAARARAAPAPLAFRSAFARRAALWGAVATAALVALLVVLSIGYGDLQSSLAIAPVSLMIAYAVLLVIGLAAGVQALAALAARRALPYRPGLYLFPVGIIDASTPRFSVYRLSELDVMAVGKQLRLRHAGGAHFEFDTPDTATAERARDSLAETRQRLERADATGDTRELATFDPLQDTGFASPFSPTTPIARPKPAWLGLALPVAVAAGVALGWGVWRARNSLSEARLFEQARSTDSVEGYQAYIARGGTRSDVTEVLLPRAELEQARRAGTVDAIEDFIGRRPNSKVHAEAMAALRAALLSELERAKKGGLAALRALPAEHPRHTLIAPELGAAIRAQYSNAFASYRRQAPAASESTLAFVQRLLAHAEKHGPTVQLRYLRRAPTAHELADIAVRHSLYFTGTVSIPSQYFDDEDAKQREQIAGKELASRLQRAFPPEIVKFELGPRVADPEAAKLEGQTPALFVEYTTHLSGTYVSSNPRGVFVGLSMMFESHLELPGGGEPLRVKHSSWTPPDLDRLKDGASIADVYQASALAAHRGFNEKISSKLLAK